MKKILLTTLITLSTYASSLSLDPANNNEVKDFLIETSRKYHLDYFTLEKHFKGLEANESIIKKLQTPFESRPWPVYKNLIVSNKRIMKGLRFYRKYQEELEQSSEKYHIPVHILVGIIGIESDYMNNLGQYKSLDALATLSFAQKSRQKFFKSELQALLRMEKEHHFNIDNLPGSYAGAIGMIQFMPSSYLNYAVSNDGYLSPDIFRSIPDSVLSIGNFLDTKCHWHANSAIAAHWHPNNQTLTKLNQLKDGIYSLDDLNKNNIQFPKKYKNSKDFAIIDGFNHKKEYWFLYPNVDSLKCYNNSLHYVLATHLLGKAIMMKHEETKG